jgi:hypothetical protein
MQNRHRSALDILRPYASLWLPPRRGNAEGVASCWSISRFTDLNLESRAVVVVLGNRPQIGAGVWNIAGNLIKMVSITQKANVDLSAVNLLLTIVW